jgi:hypothetical protein
VCCYQTELRCSQTCPVNQPPLLTDFENADLWAFLNLILELHLFISKVQPFQSQQQAGSGTGQNTSSNSVPQGQQGTNQQGLGLGGVSQTGQGQQLNRQGLKGLGTRGQQQTGQGQASGQGLQGQGQTGQVQGQGGQLGQANSNPQAGNTNAKATGDVSESASGEQGQGQGKGQKKQQTSANGGQDQGAKQKEGKAQQSDDEADDTAALNTREKRDTQLDWSDQ